MAKIRYNNEASNGRFSKTFKSFPGKARSSDHRLQKGTYDCGVGDLGTKVVEQLIEADAARDNVHFGDHRSRHEYSNKTYPTEINRAMRKIWFAYGDLGYDGINGKRAKGVINNLRNEESLIFLKKGSRLKFMKRIYKKITERLSKSTGIIGAILYGSYARKEETSRSDIDILLITKNEESKTEIQHRIIELEEEIDRIIQPTIRTLSDLRDTDTGLLQNIFEEGKILFLKEPLELPVGSLLNLKPFIIYSLKLNNLEQKEKAKFNRHFYERTSQKYKYKGLLNELNGKKLAAGCVIVPSSRKEKIERYFKKHNVIFDQIKVWK